MVSAALALRVRNVPVKVPSSSRLKVPRVIAMGHLLSDVAETVPAMARAQRPRRACRHRAFARPERSGGPGRRKNLERRSRRGREEAGLFRSKNLQATLPAG